VRILLWNSNPSWTQAFTQGPHEYVVGISHDHIRSTEFDLVILQGERDQESFSQWQGAREGRAIPTIWVEHGSPNEEITTARHPAANRSDLLVVHTSHFGQAMWDLGATRSVVIEPGIEDPGDQWTGELTRSAVVADRAVDRSREVGTDLLPYCAQVAPIDLFGTESSALPELLGSRAVGITPIEDIPDEHLPRELGRRRLFLQLNRWTSFNYSLIKAMHLGMPIVAFGTPEVWQAVPANAGFISTRVGDLQQAIDDLMHDHAFALELGAHARAVALARFSLSRFHAEWENVIKEVAS
jgi:glycosyltransferase involved in cell wall biosynthesis